MSAQSPQSKQRRKRFLSAVNKIRLMSVFQVLNRPSLLYRRKTYPTSTKEDGKKPSLSSTREHGTAPTSAQEECGKITPKFTKDGKKKSLSFMGEHGTAPTSAQEGGKITPKFTKEDGKKKSLSFMGEHETAPTSAEEGGKITPKFTKEDGKKTSLSSTGEHGTAPTSAEEEGGKITPKFTKEDDVFVITEPSLAEYVQSLEDGQVLPLDSSPSKVPRVMYSKLEPESDKKYVYIGVHHTFVHCIDDKLAEKKYVHARGPPKMPKGKGKLNSIFTHGVLSSPPATRKLLYGPGAYLTQRPAVGNLAATGWLLNLNDEELESDLWDIVQIHVFVLLETYRSWKKIVVKPVPDGGGIFESDSSIEKERIKHKLDGAERSEYGLSDEDVVVTQQSKNPIVEEIAVSEEALKGAKFLAEVIPNRSDFLGYMNYRKKNRYAKRPEGVEWSEVAVPVLELGEEKEGVRAIEDTETFKALKDYFVDFQHVKDKDNPHSYWKAFNVMREREYKYPPVNDSR